MDKENFLKSFIEASKKACKEFGCSLAELDVSERNFGLHRVGLTEIRATQDLEESGIKRTTIEGLVSVFSKEVLGRAVAGNEKWGARAVVVAAINDVVPQSQRTEEILAARNVYAKQLSIGA